MSGAARERRRLRVHGRVQGVFFRQSTAERAREIGGLVGFVRNEADGTVLCEAEGPIEALRELEAFLTAGPPAAEVTRIEHLPAGEGPLEDPFAVRS